MSELRALEATLAIHCGQMADILATPPSDQRSGTIRAAALQIFHRRGAYEQLVRSLQARQATPAGTTATDAAELRNLLQHGHQRAQIWASVEALVARQSWATSFPPLISQREEFFGQLPVGMVNMAMRALFDLSNPQPTETAVDPTKSYSDIPLSGSFFINLMTAAQRVLLAQGHTGPMRFLDMGCGGGSKVLTALGGFDTVSGVDFNPTYVAAARAFLARAGADPALITQGDALDYDGYGDFDVIYFYRPFKDPASAAKMEARVVEQARPGAVIVAPLCVSIARSNNSASRIEDPIYVAHTSADDARDLRTKACNIGCEHRPRQVLDPEALGFWAPIVLQSYQNGFVLG